MHDPSTLAFSIKRPWPHRTRFDNMRWFWPDMINVWHEDPETDGSDDSCGWAYARIPKAIQQSLEFEAGCEAREPWLLRDRAKQPISIVDAEAKLRGAILTTARTCKIKISPEKADLLAKELIHSPVDNLRSMLCFLPGWHTNYEEDRESDRKECALRLYICLARILLTRARPWWKHPRWHFWHWRIQVRPIQSFKRWAFSRCCVCGGRFSYGYAPTTNQWHGTGPLWFRSETGVEHSDCDNPRSDNAGAAATPSPDRMMN